MTEMDPPPRVRANALTAASFVPLLDVDPRVVDPLLDSLEDAGVAAYAQPRTLRSQFGGELEGRRVDPSLREQLWVDGTRRDVAATIVAAELPGLLAELRTPADPDAEFQAIVARFADEPADPVPPWPVSEDVEARPTARVSDEDLERALVWPRDTEEAPPPEDEEGHWEPPPPPPLPKAAVQTKMAILAIAVGFACIVGLQRLIGFPGGSGAVSFGILLVVGGVATLVLRMRDAPPVDDGPDDGAVV